MLWAQKGTVPAAQTMLRQLETAREEAQALAEDQAKGIPTNQLQPRKDVLTKRLQTIQSMDPDYKLISVGDLARTINHAKRKMDLCKPTPWKCPRQRLAQLPEFQRQLKDQQDGINSMLADTWDKNKEQYRQTGRTSEAKAMQEEFQARSGRPPGKAAPHNSDGYSGGHKDPTGIPADFSVNSSIGKQWAGPAPPDRAEQVSQAVKKIPELERLVTQMNVQLDVVMA